MTLPIAAAGAQVPIDLRQVGGEAGIPRGLEKSGATGGLAFADLLKDAVASANQAAQVASAKKEAFAGGGLDDIHGTMIAIKKADIELKLVANVRNKLVEAFNDLWRMNI